MKRFLCLLLVFSLVVVYFVSPVQAAIGDTGGFSSCRLMAIDASTQNVAGTYRVIDDNLFQTYLLAAYDINYQMVAATGLAPFSVSGIRFNGNPLNDYNTIIFAPGTAYVSEDPLRNPTNSVAIGGCNFPVGYTISYGSIFYSVFASGINYSCTNMSDGRYATYYLPTSDDGYVMVADLDGASATSTMIDYLEQIQSSLMSLDDWGSYINSALTSILYHLTLVESDVDSILSTLGSVASVVSSIDSRLSYLQSALDISNEHLMYIDQILWTDLPLMVEDLQYAVDFLYSIDQKLYQISNKLTTIHNDLIETNDYLEEIDKHLKAEALKDYVADNGMNVFELMWSSVTGGFNTFVSFLSFLFGSFGSFFEMSSGSFDNLDWSWNTFNYNPEEIVYDPETGGS